MIISCIRAGSSGGSSSAGLDQVQLGGLVDSVEKDEGVRIKTLGDMIDGAGEILDFVLSRSRTLEEQERGVLLKGGHVPFTRSALREQLAAVRSGGEAGTAGVSIDWNGALGGLGDDAEETVEILEEYRRTTRPTENGDVNRSEGGAQEEESRYIVDVLVTVKGASGGSSGASNTSATLFIAPFVKSTSTHGTGCTLSAAIASNVANGKDRACHPIPFDPFRSADSA